MFAAKQATRDNWPVASFADEVCPRTPYGVFPLGEHDGRTEVRRDETARGEAEKEFRERQAEEAMIEKVLSQLSDLQDIWEGLPAAHRAGGCLILGIGLLLKATSQNARDERMFFVSGLLGLLMLAYGAILFVGSTK